jgi:hypothetical protein
MHGRDVGNLKKEITWDTYADVKIISKLTLDLYGVKI